MADPKIKYDIEANVSGNADVGKLATQIEQLAGTLDGDLKTSALASADALRQLAAKDNAIQNFTDLKREAQAAAQGLKAAQDAAQAMGQQLAATEIPTRAQTGQMAKLRDAVQSAKAEVISSNTALNQARGELEQYGVSTKGLSLTQVQVKTAISDATDKVKAQAPAWQASAVAANVSAGQQVQASKQVSDGMKSVADQIGNAKNMVLAFAGAQGLAGSVKDVAVLADAWSNMKSRLQLALGAQTDINAAMVDVEAVAKRSYTSLDATANLYGKIATAGKDMGVSQQQALAVTETINRAIQLSGASAQASDAAVTQLIQSLQSGVLRGDEFNSMMEQAPRLSKALADGLNVPIGSLRGMAEQGKLTSQAVVRALQDQSAAIGKEFSSLPVTIGRAVQNVQTEWQKFVGTMDTTTGASASVAAGIESIGKHLDDLARIAAATGAALTASFAIQAAQALRAAAVQMAATGGAAALLRRDLDTLSRPVNIAIAVTGFEVGYQIGTMLYENSEMARKFGAGLVSFFAQVVNDLQLLKEAAAAVFTSDTVDAALNRYVKRNIEIGDRLKDMFADAEKAPSKVGDAVDAAAGKTQAMGAAAQAAGAAVARAGAAGGAGMSKIGTAAEEARNALEGIATVINQAAPVDNGITAIVRDLTAAKSRAVDVDLVLRQQLPEAISKLNGPELSAFRAEFTRAMDQAGFKGKELRTGLSLIGEQAAKSLGVDVPLSFNTLSESFVSARGNLSVLIRELPALKAAGVDTAAVVTQALDNMVNGAKSRAELNAVKFQIEAVRNVLGDKLADGLLDQAKTKALELADALDKAKPGVNSLREAMAELGLKSRDDLQRTADKARDAYDVIKASGQAEGESYVAWQARKTEAARVMLERALLANGGIADSTITARAAMEGLEIQTDATGKAIVKAMGGGSVAAGQLGDSVRATTADMVEQQKLLEAINAKYAGTALKSTTGTNREERLTGQNAVDDTLRLRLAQKLQAGTLTQADAGDVQAFAAAVAQNVAVSQSASPGLISTDFMRSLQTMQNQVLLMQQAVNARPLAATVNVRITLPDGNVKSVPTTKAGSEELIAALQVAKLAAGY